MRPQASAGILVEGPKVRGPEVRGPEVRPFQIPQAGSRPAEDQVELKKRVIVRQWNSRSELCVTILSTIRA